MPGETQTHGMHRLDPARPEWEKVQAVARIRNAGREWFTGDTREIDPQEQILWYAESPRSLYVYEVDGKVVGFALLTERDGKTWVSLGVHPDYQGQGIGTRIYGQLYDVFAEIRPDNTASRRSAEKAGYKIVHADKDKVVMYG